MTDEEEQGDQRAVPEISRFAFAMFDVLGFSQWVESESLSSIVAAYRQLIERAVLKPNEKGSLSAFHTPEGMLLAVTRAPEVAYFSDTILLWCPLAPPLVGDFVERCGDLMCEALAMNIPLRGAITLGDAVLDNKSSTYVGKPIVEAAMLEKGQDWVGLTLGNTAMWSSFLAQLHGASIIEYAAPMKKGYEQYAAPVVVDWPRRWRDKNTNDLSSKLDELNKTPAFAKYWNNAKAFAEYSLSKHDWFKYPERIPPDAVLRLVPLSEAKLA
jgi:hypothetical protein